MKLWTATFIYICVIHTNGIKQIRHSDVMKISGFDCRKPSSLVSYSKNDWCKKKAEVINPLGDNEARKLDVTIIQKFKRQNIRGIRCTKRISRFLIYCGVYSHQKFFKPPTILEPDLMTTEECKDTFTRRAYINHERTIKIPVNGQIQYQEIPHGKIWATTENTYCTGAKFEINGEIHEQMLELKTVEISMTEVDILISDNKISDLNNNVELEKGCMDNMKCVIGTHTYLLLDQPASCKWAKVRSMQLTPIQLMNKGIPTTYHINPEHKIILRKLNQQKIDDCQITATITDYPEVMLVEGEQDKLIELSEMTAHPEILDLDLELRISEEYLHYEMERALQEQVADMQQHLCSISAENLQHMERSPLHIDALIRIRGDIIQEMKCQTVEVTTSLGYKRGEDCYRDHLPVYLNEEPVYLDTSKLIVDKPLLDSINCVDLFPPIFITKDGTLIQAVPQIEKVQITLSKPEGIGFHISAMEHLEETDHLLYTEKELQAYRELFHSQKSRKALQYAITDKYCSTPAACGNYQPSGNGNFDLSYLSEETLKILDWKQYMLETVAKYGNYASIGVLLYLLVRLIYVMICMVLTRRKGTTWGTAFRLNVMILDEFRNSMIRATPTRRTQEQEVIELGPLEHAIEN